MWVGCSNKTSNFIVRPSSEDLSLHPKTQNAKSLDAFRVRGALATSSMTLMHLSLQCEQEISQYVVRVAYVCWLE